MTNLIVQNDCKMLNIEKNQFIANINNVFLKIFLYSTLLTLEKEKEKEVEVL
jgi:hypothetical protein